MPFYHFWHTAFLYYWANYTAFTRLIYFSYTTSTATAVRNLWAVMLQTY